jgi:hypothetical protein
MIMDEIKKELRTIRESQIRTELDVKYHIKRTNLLEAKVVPVYTAYTGIKWSIPAILVIGTIIARIKGFI